MAMRSDDASAGDHFLVVFQARNGGKKTHGTMLMIVLGAMFEISPSEFLLG
jgi:hypothetical protein